ncbi:11-S seed storage protein, conserved site-containing protein [Artemisia annua]|uniref:11-S seed storage protein, conserved site-containing protein n=1 Tax=Artemisia annua TaxID=35608 RepID=A0A2U1KQ20_ARTAN|nr:11-S seed storage protein, conserved site-containing protein [Artemisia annua]
MFAEKVLLWFFFCLLSTTVIATTRSPHLGGGQQLCNLQRLAATKPALRFDFEGGSIETWDVNDDQLKCVGEGMIGVDFPGCPETFDTGLQQEQQETRDSWDNLYESLELETQLPHSPRAVVRLQKNHSTETSFPSVLIRFNFDNIFAGFNTELLAEAFNIKPRIVRLMQESSENGIIIKVKEPMQIVTPEEEKQQEPRKQGRGGSSNGFEEKMCNATILHNLDSQSEADIFSRQAGKLNTVNENKLPIRSYLDLSAEKGYLQQQSLGTWSQISKLKCDLNNVGINLPMLFKKKLGDGRNTTFWHDNWLGGSSLRDTFPRLYQLETMQNCFVFERAPSVAPFVPVADVRLAADSTVNNSSHHHEDLQGNNGPILQPNIPITGQTFHWAWRRRLRSHEENMKLCELQDLLLNLNLSMEQDTWEFTASPSRCFLVKQGDIFVVPQFFATTARAGQNGFEWVAFKTNKSPMKSPVAGYTSVFRAMPIEVITNTYDVSPSQAQNLKTNRETESILLSPQRISYQLS